MRLATEVKRDALVIVPLPPPLFLPLLCSSSSSRSSRVLFIYEFHHVTGLQCVANVITIMRAYIHRYHSRPASSWLPLVVNTRATSFPPEERVSLKPRDAGKREWRSN